MLVTYQITLSNHSLSLLLQKNTNNRTFRATKFPRCDNFIRIPEIHIHRASTVQVSFLSDYRVIGNIIRGGKDIYIYIYIFGFSKSIGRLERIACNLRGNASGRRSKVFRARASYEDEDVQWGREREVPVFRGDVAGGPPCEMPQQKLQCGDCKNRLPDLTTDMCRLLSYKSLNGLVRERDRRRKQDGKERKGEEEGNGKLDDKVRG